MPRLGAMERVVFEHARPGRVVVTTPNREYNVRWETLAAEQMRHRDHRFEWTRAECQAWAERVAAKYGYTATRQDLGPLDDEVGAPSQIVIFDRVNVETPDSNGPVQRDGRPDTIEATDTTATGTTGEEGRA